MKLLKEIHQSDIGVSNAKGEILYKIRKAARAIVINKENCIAILDVTKDGYNKLPGGGMENGENIEEALRREIKEEVGADIDVCNELGCIIEYRDNINQIQISYCYISKVVGEIGELNLTQTEINDGFQLKWYTIEEAIKIMNNDNPKSYIGKFIKNRDILFLKELYDIINEL